jgi:hypothetical protein
MKTICLPMQEGDIKKFSKGKSEAINQKTMANRKTYKY